MEASAPLDCPNCNAVNPDDAKWCSLCLEPFEEDDTESSLEIEIPPLRIPPESHEVEKAWEAVVRGLDGSPPSGASSVTSWPCPVCGSLNPVEADICASCGTDLIRAVLKRAEPSRTQVSGDPRIAAALSIVPGAGHIYLRRTSDGIVRLVLAFWWLGSGLLLAGAPPAVAPVRALFFIALAGLILISVVDAFRTAVASEAKPLLGRRAIVLSSIAVVTLTAFGAFLAIVSASR